MELQNKFKEIINDIVHSAFKGLNVSDIAAKQCTILCLEEQVKLCLEIQGVWTERSLVLQQQLNLLKDGN